MNEEGRGDKPLSGLMLEECRILRSQRSRASQQHCDAEYVILRDICAE